MDGMSSQAFVSPSGPIDKSRVLDVKPLRSLTPVFPSSPETPPFVCSPPFGPYPPGFTPFYPFNMPQSSQNPPKNATPIRSVSHHPTQTPPAPTPLRSYRASQPGSAGGPSQFTGASNGYTESSMDEDGFEDSQKRSGSRSRSSQARGLPRKNSKAVDGVYSGKELVMRLDSAQKEDGNKETVEFVLMAFDALRRRLSQIDDSKEATTGIIKRSDLKAGTILMSKSIRTNMRKKIGNVPGVDVGDIFFFRMELCLAGVHAQSMGGIDTMLFKSDSGQDPLAISIVSSGGYGDVAEDTNVLIYSGQGGNMSKKDKQVADQKLERGNLALDRSSKRANEVRVIRGVKDILNPTSKVYVYDGLYTIRESWVEKGKSGCNVFKYKLVRQPGQPSAYAIWKSIQKWKEGFANRNGFILPDLTSGAESIPVSLVNDVDAERGPAYFTYAPSLRNSKPFNFSQPSFGCNCHGICKPGDLNCSCIRKNGGDFPYTTHGILVSRKPLIHECGPQCPCFPKCKNRVSQTGLKFRFEVFKTPDRGWGLRSWDPIRAGTFICQYAGEVVEKINHGDDYFFDTTYVYDNSFKWNHEPALLDEERINDANEEYNVPSPLRISSKNVGNIARFMNHSCHPNVFWQPVAYELDNQVFLNIAFYAIKHIPPMTELTYDYGKSDDQSMGMLNRKRKCLCGSPKCQGYFG